MDQQLKFLIFHGKHLYLKRVVMHVHIGVLVCSTGCFLNLAPAMCVSALDAHTI